jgi:hypothetical protein
MSSEETLPQTHRYPMGALGGTGEDDVDLHSQTSRNIVLKTSSGRVACKMPRRHGSSQ